MLTDKIQGTCNECIFYNKIGGYCTLHNDTTIGVECADFERV